ncbi:Pyruvate decarboxylase 1 [Acorus gramineus]|uniref:pyruvate decarboxylase n=1 Tax=Acorus gramineus TaxID=55184 RepID=A0AAV9AXM9_ACOGR|nr:Pyruvate decarboxylase 1 [Acorus gramineus]
MEDITRYGDRAGTLGRHLARRLVQVGARDVFSVPGDFNLALLDHLIDEPGLNLVGCCNELNAGYAADGYARSGEDLPVICVVGGPNSNDYGSGRILHHTIGVPDFSQELRCFQAITCHQAVVNNLEDAHEQIDTAISTALKESKPVYISISCNLPGIPHSTFLREPVPYFLAPTLSNRAGLEAAVDAAAEFLNKAVKPVIIGGPRLRVSKAQEAFVALADACGYPVQGMLSGDSAVISETGDSWFNCQKLRLPENCGFEFQMQYGSIGWSVGATLGYAQACKDKRVIACIGDGSFQVTAQDISTMIRCGQRSVIFLINNGGYTIEVEIHDGPYNVIKNWDYTRFVDAIHNGEGKCWTAKVRTEEELVEAIGEATGPRKESLCFIEVIVHRDDTSKELLEWGSRVSAANSRPPNPQ